MKRGFTLIELLSVLVVLGIVGSIIGVSVTNALKDYRINLETCEYMGVMYRGDTEEKEKLICGSINHPPYDKIEEQREEIEQFYQINETQKSTLFFNRVL